MQTQVHLREHLNGTNERAGAGGKVAAIEMVADADRIGQLEVVLA